MLDALPAYVPGRTVPGAIKLASNETPYPPLPHVLARIAAAAGSVNRYPDSFSTTLVSALAIKCGVDPAQVAVGCGSVSLCTQLAQAAADADDEIIYAWRSFEAYPIIAAVTGASAVQVPLRDYVHDLDAMADQVTGKTRLIFVCNPNNPTGTAVGRDELVAFLRRVPEHVVVALDEAYREFVTDPAVPDALTLLAEFRTWSCSVRSPRHTDWRDCASGTPLPATRGWLRRCDRRRCRSRSRRSPRRRHWPAWSRPPRRSYWSASPTSSPNAAGSLAGSPSWAMTCPRPRPTSSGSRSVLPRWTGRGAVRTAA
jgi:hypothetical protein